MSDSDTQPLLRILTAITFIPSLPLCIIHGVLSQNPIPAVGLAPMALSAGYSVLLLTYRRRSKRKQNNRRSIGHAEEDNDLESVRNGDEAGISSSQPLIEGGAEEPEYAASERSQAEQTPAWEEEAKEKKTPLYAHTIFIFLVDSILAAGVMVVLVFTWINTQKGRTGITNPVLGGKLAMLAAYATIPLLANFLIHTYLALRGFAIGLALYPLVQYAAWHTLPPNCPNCSSRLRPTSRPKIPWYDFVSRPRNLCARPTFKAPKWWSNRQQRRTVVDVVSADGVDDDATARLFVRNDDLESVSHLGEGVLAVERYRDEPDVDEDAGVENVETRSYRDEPEGEDNDHQEREQEGQPEGQGEEGQEQQKGQTEDLLQAQLEGQQEEDGQQQQQEQDNDARSERLERIGSHDQVLALI
ncbi:hypothetical protein GE21DRAFT_7084 [Neurospora crassa]|uniref:Uncharacterized protein n=2 Tax=Neurospora crassa TaxID=5141 RepID=Q1K641_NEUCR|nr:hypothetical protein NCU04622 [Neurospora crassa OR74A]EAA28942.1 hypothetical protein NCU04622 [Neurospora crassa OR74A]KHE79436.1 hypothetical protein GE21DRAFT_7084 [Neurospora crassa]CAD37063.1 related to nucleosome binding protein [Neurospora crassa]|eukprot:XP_958178.1 hypothetical protein NCU04622 [Neurospora crassa OR74A]